MLDDMNMRTLGSKHWVQRCQPPIFSPDICAKSESNPKCLRKSLHQTNPNRRVFAMKPVLRQKRVFSTKPFSWQKRVFVKLQLGHVIIGMIPATPSMHEKHAFDHKKIGSAFKQVLFNSPSMVLSIHIKKNCGSCLLLLPNSSSIYYTSASDTNRHIKFNQWFFRLDSEVWMITNISRN